MARIDEIRDALLEAPEEFGLELVYPFPRTDGPLRPVNVLSAEVEQETVLLTFDRKGLKGSQELVPGDILYHDRSGMTVLVIQRVSRTSARAQGLTAPEGEEDRNSFVRTKGEGHWLPCFQGWKKGWALPSELRSATELVDACNRHVWDLFPNTTAHGRMGGFQGQGHIDPDRMKTPKTSAFLRRQRRAMQELFSGVPREEEAQLPELAQMEKGEVVDTFIPLDGSGAKETRVSARKRKGGIVSSGAPDREKRNVS